ncbi:MAG: c-type cytochrome [Bacteroidota bacterium]
MKLKFTTLLFTIAIIVFSGINASAQSKAKKPVAKKGSADIAEGKALIAKSDCLTCHKLDMKVVGPAYKDVAAKYPPTEANFNLLIAKVMNGGSGTWGPVAMAPHTNLSSGDVKKMIAYILSVK